MNLQELTEDRQFHLFIPLEGVNKAIEQGKYVEAIKGEAESAEETILQDSYLKIRYNGDEYFGRICGQNRQKDGRRLLPGETDMLTVFINLNRERYSLPKMEPIPPRLVRFRINKHFITPRSQINKPAYGGEGYRFP